MTSAGSGTSGVRTAFRGVVSSFGVLLRELARSVGRAVSDEERSRPEPGRPGDSSGPPQAWLDYVNAHDPVWLRPAAPAEGGKLDQPTPVTVPPTLLATHPRQNHRWVESQRPSALHRVVDRGRRWAAVKVAGTAAETADGSTDRSTDRGSPTPAADVRRPTGPTADRGTPHSPGLGATRPSSEPQPSPAETGWPWSTGPTGRRGTGEPRTDQAGVGRDGVDRPKDDLRREEGERPPDRRPVRRGRLVPTGVVAADDERHPPARTQTAPPPPARRFQVRPTTTPQQSADTTTLQPSADTTTLQPSADGQPFDRLRARTVVPPVQQAPTPPPTAMPRPSESRQPVADRWPTLPEPDDDEPGTGAVARLWELLQEQRTDPVINEQRRR